LQHTARLARDRIFERPRLSDLGATLAVSKRRNNL
jgi:hypothetical protein